MRSISPTAALIILAAVAAAGPSTSIASASTLRINHVRLVFDRDAAAFGGGYFESRVTGSDDDTTLRVCISHRCKRLYRDPHQPSYTAMASLWRIQLRPGQRRLVSITATTPTRQRAATYRPRKLIVRSVPQPPASCDGFPEPCEFPSP